MNGFAVVSNIVRDGVLQGRLTLFVTLSLKNSNDGL